MHLLHEAKHYAQLAKNLKDIPASKREKMWPGYTSAKLDGVFMFAVCANQEVTFFSRTGETVVSCKGTRMEEELLVLHLTTQQNFVLVGEFYLDGAEQAVISGVFRKQVEGHAIGFSYYVHDLLTLDEFSLGKAERTYLQRLYDLDTLLKSTRQSSVVLVDQYPCDNEEQFVSRARAIQQLGGEGAIYRPADAGWAAGDRSTNLVRIKEEISYDLEVVRVNEVKRGPKGGLLGSIGVRFRRYGEKAGSELIIDVRGMSHEQLMEWAEDPSLVVGKIVKVTAMRFTNLGSLREPRFKEVRFDKEEADL